MMDEQHRGRGRLTDEELELLAESIFIKLETKHTCKPCKITADQQQAVIDLISQKKKVVRITLWLIGALVVWIVKDVYIYISSRIGIVWGIK